MNKIEISINAGGYGKLIVDGKDVSNTTGGFNLRVRPGKITTLFVKLIGDVEATVEGEVRALPTTVADPRVRYEKIDVA